MRLLLETLIILLAIWMVLGVDIPGAVAAVTLALAAVLGAAEKLFCGEE